MDHKLIHSAILSSKTPIYRLLLNFELPTELHKLLSGNISMSYCPRGVNTNTYSKLRIKSPITWPISAFFLIVWWNTCAALISSLLLLCLTFLNQVGNVTGDEESDFGQFVADVFWFKWILGQRKMSKRDWKIFGFSCYVGVRIQSNKIKKNSSAADITSSLG